MIVFQNQFMEVRRLKPKEKSLFKHIFSPLASLWVSSRPSPLTKGKSKKLISHFAKK
jgi:hypothetical protein